MYFRSLFESLQKIFIINHKTDVEQFIASKNPKTTADVEHWLQQYTYNNRHWSLNA
jgi:hypothetical protein